MEELSVLSPDRTEGQTKLDAVGVTDEYLAVEIKKILDKKVKRSTIRASDKIRVMELVAKIKGWVKEDGNNAKEVVNYLNMPIDEIKVQFNNIVSEYEKIIEYGKKQKDGQRD